MYFYYLDLSLMNFLCAVRDLELQGNWAMPTWSVNRVFPITVLKGRAKSQHQVKHPFRKTHKEAFLCWMLRDLWQYWKLKAWALTCSFPGNLRWDSKCIAETLWQLTLIIGSFQIFELVKLEQGPIFFRCIYSFLNLTFKSDGPVYAFLCEYAVSFSSFCLAKL